MINSATIKIDATKIVGKIDNKIYGHFIENLARCIYGGLVQDNKIREDVVEAVKKLRPPIIRWPGGLYADGYNWRDGIGKIRKTKINRYWARFFGILGFFDPHTFGTDEFIKFCREVAAEPYININYGTGSIKEAVEWLRYTNMKKLYEVKYWGIGNEIYGFWSFGHTTAKNYARRYIEFCKAMKKVDKNIKFIAVGADDNYPLWNKEVLNTAAEYIDYLSIHIYPLASTNPIYMLTTRLDSNEKHYYSIVAAPKVVEQKLQWACDKIKEAHLEGKVYLALDEWNIWWNYFQLLGAKYTIRDAIFVAGVLNVLHRMAEVVKIANLSQLINVLGLIQTSKDDLFLTPSYFVFYLYSNFAQSQLLKVDISSPTYNCARLRDIPAMKNIPYIDCSATINTNNDKLTLFIINRHFKEKIKLNIRIDNFKLPKKIKVYELTAPQANSRNDFNNKEEVKITEKVTITKSISEFTYVALPHSILCFRILPLAIGH